MKTERKTVLAGISGLLILLVIVIAGMVILKNKTQIEQLNQQNSNLTTTIEVRDSLVNEMTRTFDEIEQNLTFVRNKRAEMVTIPQEGVKNQKEILVADVKLMNEMLEESSIKIDELDKKLKSSGIEIKSFKNKIVQLNKMITEQDNNIQQLRTEIEQRDYKIAEMDVKLVKLQSDIASKDDSIVIKSSCKRHS